MNPSNQTRADEVASAASDARPELYHAQTAQWEAFAQEEAPGISHVVVQTSKLLAVSVEQVLDALGMPRLVCQL